YSYNSKAYIILNKHAKRIEESLNVTFDETPSPFKRSPLVDDDLDEEEAIKVTEKKNIEKDIEDDTLEIEEVVNIKESRNHPLENIIGDLNQRSLRSQADKQEKDKIRTIPDENGKSGRTRQCKESDEFIKSSVENLVPNPSEFEDECEYDVPDCDDSQTINFSTFSNPLFDDSTSSDDESIHEEVIHEMSFKTYSNLLFDLDEEIISKSYPLESLLNHDTLIISSLKIDSLLAEFVGELIFFESIPLGIDEANCDHGEDIHLVERLLYDNSSPHPPKEFVSENSNAEIESFFPPPIPVEDSDSHMKEIDLFLTPDDPMPPSIEYDDDDDSERDIPILKEFPSNYSLLLPVNKSFYFDIPSLSRPPAKPPDVVQYSRKVKDSCQRILSSKSLFPQLQLGINNNLKTHKMNGRDGDPVMHMPNQWLGIVLEAFISQNKHNKAQWKAQSVYK
nr:hypothetical protein [Tanacetum cinerariifolium]